MLWCIFSGSLAGILSASLFTFLFSSRIRSRLYGCECDLADLQDRHLRTVRREAAKERWDHEGLSDEQLKLALGEPAKKKGWTKWPSSGASENSSEARSNP